MHFFFSCVISEEKRESLKEKTVYSLSETPERDGSPGAATSHFSATVDGNKQGLTVILKRQWRETLSLGHNTSQGA